MQYLNSPLKGNALAGRKCVLQLKTQARGTSADAEVSWCEFVVKLFKDTKIIQLVMIFLKMYSFITDCYEGTGTGDSFP